MSIEVQCFLETIMVVNTVPIVAKVGENEYLTIVAQIPPLVTN